ncbi:protein kinase domain-containing protein [Nocardia sp. CA-290969]|uniref:serine/threonine-protein kinase n=1 Tax=Nocardia sp. CA-290969 TaxID=3239986 RepID=UPI003D8A618E
MATLKPGAVFAGYTIERLLGAGGMGEVYVARHPRLPRSDAVKVLAAQFTDDDSYRRRFEREADLAASLSHPGIVSVHDRGEFEGRLWIALELIDGTDLSASLIAAPAGLPVADVVRAITEVAHALDYAGARGLIHRDVKPANILLAATGHYLLTDFGIARMGPETSDLTGTGGAVGTVAYASPEQMQGLPLDPRSDQYSLAATAFHLLTGTQAFTGTNQAAVILAHAQQPVPSARERRPGLAPAVDAVFRRAMAKTPEHRFATTEEFATALGRAFAPPEPHAEQPAEPADRYADTVVNPAAVDTEPRDPTPPPDLGTSGQGPARRQVSLLIGTLVAVVALVVAGALGFRAFQQYAGAKEHDAGAEEAARLPRRPVTPILPSLEKRPDAPVWTLADIPGPPGNQQHDPLARGGDSEVVLFSRTIDPDREEPIEYLDVVDANTGRLWAGTQPIVVDTTGSLDVWSCAVSESHTAAACHLGDRHAMKPDTLIVVDFATSRIITTITTEGSISGLTAAGGRFVFADITYHVPPSLRSIGVDGREFPAITWPDASPMPADASDDRYWIEIFEPAELAVIRSAPDPGHPLSKWELRVIRLEDGKEVFRRDSVEEIGDDDWNVFLDGFVVADGQAPPGIYDRNGARTAQLPEGWQPSRPLTNDYRTWESWPGETSVPTAIHIDGDKTTYAAISPRTGTVLWKQQSSSEDPLWLYGVGDLIRTSESGRVVDAYTGESVLPDPLPDGPVLGTDGSRIAVTTAPGEGYSLEVWSSDGLVWKVPSESTPMSIGGKIYVQNLRIF